MVSFGLVLCGAKNPARVFDEIGCHVDGVAILNRQILSGCGGENDARRVPQFGFGFEDSVAAVGGEFGNRNQFFVWPDWMDKTNIEFRAKSKAFGLDRASPDHDFIQNGGNDSAMNRRFESDVLLSGQESRADDPAIGFEPQIEPGRIRYSSLLDGQC